MTDATYTEYETAERNIDTYQCDDCGMVCEPGTEDHWRTILIYRGEPKMELTTKSKWSHKSNKTDTISFLDHGDQKLRTADSTERVRAKLPRTTVRHYCPGCRDGKFDSYGGMMDTLTGDDLYTVTRRERLTRLLWMLTGPVIWGFALAMSIAAFFALSMAGVGNGEVLMGGITMTVCWAILAGLIYYAIELEVKT